MATAAIVKHIEVYVKKFPHLEAILDEAVEKVLILKNELGLFEDPYRGVDPEREMRELRSPDKKGQHSMRPQSRLYYWKITEFYH